MDKLLNKKMTMVEATEFPALADQFNVSSVTQATFNHGAGMALCAVPEDQLLEAIQSALSFPA